MKATRPTPPGVGELIDVAITEIGTHGDGVADVNGERLFVPYTLPGDHVRARRIGASHAVPVAWHRRSPTHNQPACDHFGTCGGCALQHLDDGTYAEWKLTQLRTALAHRGFGEVEMQPLVRTAPGTRRRADFGVVRTESGVIIGFHGYKSRRLVDMATCAVLHPSLVALLPPLRELFSHLLAPGRSADVLLTQSETGIDVLIGRVPDLDPGQRQAIAAFAAAHGVARVAWRRRGEPAEIVVQYRAPTVTFGNVPVEIPPAAFLQASPAGEAAIVAAVLAGADGAAKVADLYAGCGTLTFPLAARSRVRAVEGAAELADAVTRAARRSGLVGRVNVETRDLARRPLLAEELRDLDAVVFDPPRDGASAQAAELAGSRVPVVVGVSCNSTTFARDARILVDGGYRLVALTPIDQFPWTPHLEIVAVFRR